MRLRKILLSAVTLGTFVLYILTLGKKEVAVIPPTPTPSMPEPTSPLPPPVPSPVPVLNPSPSPSTPAPVPPPPPPLGKYANGTFTGSIADAFYGNIEVQAVIEGGKLTDVI